MFDLGVLGILDAGEGTELLVWEPEFKDTLLLPKPIKIKSNNQTQIYNLNLSFSPPPPKCFGLDSAT